MFQTQDLVQNVLAVIIAEHKEWQVSLPPMNAMLDSFAYLDQLFQIHKTESQGIFAQQANTVCRDAAEPENQLHAQYPVLTAITTPLPLQNLLYHAWNVSLAHFAEELEHLLLLDFVKLGIIALKDLGQPTKLAIRQLLEIMPLLVQMCSILVHEESTSHWLFKAPVLIVLEVSIVILCLWLLLWHAQLVIIVQQILTILGWAFTMMQYLVLLELTMHSHQKQPYQIVLLATLENIAQNSASQQ